MGIFELATSTEWAIRPDFHRAMMEIAAREEVTPEAVRSRIGKPIENTRKATKRSGVGIIPIIGPTFRRANMFMEISGATSIEMLSLDLQTAIDDPEIHSIILEIDSPGGQVSGTAEFAAMVKGSKKPVYAYIDGDGCSAAYWVASACKSITISSTSQLGCLGVAATFSRDAKSAKELEFVSSRTPNKRPNLDTKEGKAIIQNRIDSIADVFISSVAENRGVSIETVDSEFGQGDVFVGQKAVAAGMADHVGTFESLLDLISSGTPPKRATAPTSQEKRPMASAIESVEISATELAELRAKLDSFSAMESRLAASELSEKTFRLSALAATREGVLTTSVAFIDSQVKDGRLLPSSKSAATTLLIQAGLDDAGIQTHVASMDAKGVFSLLEAASNPTVRGPAFEAFIKSLPQNSYVKEYLSSDSDLTILSNDKNTGEAHSTAYLDKQIEKLNARNSAKNK